MEKRIDPITGEETWEPTTLKEVTESIIEMRRLLHQETLKRKEEWEAQRKREEEQRKHEEEQRKKREEEQRKREEEQRKKYEEERKKREEKWAAEYEKLKAESQVVKQELDKNMNKFFGQFTTQWGRILEAVTTPAALKMFQDIGIDIDHVFQEARHRKEERQEMEADVILVNTTAVVVVEVKTTLKPNDVDYFLQQMNLFKDLFREFKDKTVYVAVAAIKFDGCSDIYAKKKGVFVLRCNGEAIFGLDNVPEERRRRY